MPHHKYKTPYLKVAEYNYDGRSWNFTEPDLYNSVFNLNNNEKLSFVVTDHKPSELNPLGKYLYQKIASKISICEIADAFGLLPLGKSKRICPFHHDSNPSLSLNNELGVFCCFGCHTSGNLIKFYALLKQINPNFKYALIKHK